MPKARVQRIKNNYYVYIETSHRVPGRNYPDHKRLYIGTMNDSVFKPNAKFFALSDEQKKATGLEWDPQISEEPSRNEGDPFFLLDPESSGALIYYFPLSPIRLAFKVI